MEVLKKLQTAHQAGQVMTSAFDTFTSWWNADYFPVWVQQSMQELVEKEAWEEINDRFYQNLAFGTGGMRGRTIGKVSTSVEIGTPNEQETPEHPAVGTNVLNDFNLVRATVGFYKYVEQYLQNKGSSETPTIVIAHDVRHFARYFCELAASTWTKLGGKAIIFDGPRSTPQLSFSVRYLQAHAGVVLTASHNPPHDNGFKAYFEDGAQVVSPHAEGIVDNVLALEMSETVQYLDIDISQVITAEASVDEAYQTTLFENLVAPEELAKTDLSVVFSPIHGTGAVSSLPVLEKAGIRVSTVEKQMVQDARFPTVKSPNPENTEALQKGIDLATSQGADIVLATDPDSDRMGAVARNHAGEYIVLNGNMIGSMLAAYRIGKLKQKGFLPEEGTPHAALIKTFVTTPLQAAIAKQEGLKLIETLTGFKWIGAKLAQYEKQLTDKMGADFQYDKTPLEERNKLLLEHSTFYVFGGEESYGYLAGDQVRDKDANLAVLLFCEMAADLKNQGKSVLDYLDELYLKYGYYSEHLVNIYLEGASGAQKIKKILDSYRSDTPSSFGDVTVSRFMDFGREEFFDADGDKIPSQDFYKLELSDGYSFAVRGSGTEPKIKFYLFAKEDVSSAEELPSIKSKTRERIAILATQIEKDALARAEA